MKFEVRKGNCQVQGRKKQRGDARKIRRCPPGTQEADSARFGAGRTERLDSGGIYIRRIAAGGAL